MKNASAMYISFKELLVAGIVGAKWFDIIPTIDKAWVERIRDSLTVDLTLVFIHRAS
jgi:hypothetical protein